MKRVLALLLALLMLSMTFVACGKNGEGEESGATTVNTAAPGETLPYNPEIDGLYFDGMVITMVQNTFPDIKRNEFSGGDDEGDSVNALLHDRNKHIEEKFGVMFDFVDVSEAAIQDKVRTNNLSQDSEIDLYSAYAYYGLAMSAEGAYYNLYDVPYLNTTASWWNQSWNETIEFNGQLFGVTGDANTSVILKTFVTFVNNDMLAEWYPTNTPDLYSVVNEGKWTLEYVQNLTKEIYADNGDVSGERDEKDTYGITLAPISQPSQALVMGCGYQWTETNANGEIEFTLGTERNINILQSIQSMFAGDKTGVYTPKSWYGAYYYATNFARGKNMLAMAPMFTAEQLAATNINYSILPMPKFDESQPEYISSTQDSHTFCAVSMHSDAIHAVGAILEYMGYLSERDLTPEYFDNFYKYKYASDPDTMEMFDTIIDSIEFEFAVNWSRSLHDVLKKVRELAANPNVGAASEIESISGACSAYLESLKETLDEFSLAG